MNINTLKTKMLEKYENTYHLKLKNIKKCKVQKSKKKDNW